MELCQQGLPKPHKYQHEACHDFVAAHFYLKFLSNLILSLKNRFDKVKDHKLSTL